MAELADATDLKSVSGFPLCGFESRSRHQIALQAASAPELKHRTRNRLTFLGFCAQTRGTFRVALRAFSLCPFCAPFVRPFGLHIIHVYAHTHSEKYSASTQTRIFTAQNVCLVTTEICDKRFLSP